MHQPQNIFSRYPFSRGGNLLSFLCTMIWLEMNNIAIGSATRTQILYSSWIDLLFIRCLLTWVPWQGIMQRICCTCWKRTLKISYCTHWCWEGASRFYFIYQVLGYNWRDSKEYALAYCDGLNQTLLAQKYPGSFPNIFYDLEAYGIH